MTAFKLLSHIHCMTHLEILQKDANDRSIGFLRLNSLSCTHHCIKCTCNTDDWVSLEKFLKWLLLKQSSRVSLLF